MMTDFAIIPVIDLAGGLVVHARGGDRSRYRALVSPLARSADPLAVIAGFLALAPFKHLYVADLDAITRVGGHAAMIADLALRFPDVEFLVDAGIATLDAARATRASGVTPVVGSETLRTLADWRAILDALGPDSVILSLDSRDGAALGASGIEGHADLWPARVIAMTLARVGAGAGPDFDALSGLVAAAGGGRRVHAAGGVRDSADVDALKARGVSGALVASALHSGALRP